jgi:hypothetical protein
MTRTDAKALAKDLFEVMALTKDDDARLREAALRRVLATRGAAADWSTIRGMLTCDHGNDRSPETIFTVLRYVFCLPHMVGDELPSCANPLFSAGPDVWRRPKKARKTSVTRPPRGPANHELAF